MFIIRQLSDIIATSSLRLDKSISTNILRKRCGYPICVETLSSIISSWLAMMS